MGPISAALHRYHIAINGLIDNPGWVATALLIPHWMYRDHLGIYRLT